MAEQTIELAASWYDANVSAKRWVPPSGSRPEFDEIFRGSFPPNFLVQFLLYQDGRVGLYIAHSQAGTPGQAGEDLSAEFEQNGSLEIVVGGNSLLVALAGADFAEPYIWTPSNSAEVIAFHGILSDVDGTESGQLIIRDFVPSSKVYKGATKITKAYKGTTELDRIYKGSVQVF